MTALKELSLMYLEDNKVKYPSLPDYARTSPKFTDKTANGLTKCVIEWLRLTGNQAERISNTGRYIDNRETYVDAVGFKRTIGSGKYIPGSGTKGTADISSTIKVNISGREVGISVKWEVKMKDKQSDVQIKYEEAIQKSGGYYFIIHSLEEFREKLLSLLAEFN